MQDRMMSRRSDHREIVNFPNWMKPMIKEEKKLKEGFEKLSEKKDNMPRISCLAFSILKGVS